MTEELHWCLAVCHLLEADGNEKGVKSAIVKLERNAVEAKEDKSQFKRQALPLYIAPTSIRTYHDSHPPFDNIRLLFHYSHLIKIILC